MRKALVKQKAAREALDETPMNLTLSQPVIPKENFLVDSGTLRIVCGGRTDRGTLAKMEAAGNLAAAAWPRQLDICARHDRANTPLAGTANELMIANGFSWAIG